MFSLSRKKLASTAQEIADHLQLVDHVKALQMGQRDLSDAIVTLGDRLRKLELEMSTLKAETKFEALKEAQDVVYSVQSGLNQRIQDIAVKLAVAEVETRRPPALQPPPPPSKEPELIVSDQDQP